MENLWEPRLESSVVQQVMPYDVRPAWDCVPWDVDCCRSLQRIARENPWAKKPTGIDKEHPGDEDVVAEVASHR